MMRTRSSAATEGNASGTAQAEWSSAVPKSSLFIVIATQPGRADAEMVSSLREALLPVAAVMTSDFEDTRPRLADAILVVDGWGGMSLLRAAEHCQNHFNSPILLAILNESSSDVSEALDSGFDYCGRWPIPPADVAAWVRAALRRLGKSPSSLSLDLDPTGLRVRCRGVEATLTKSQFAVLSALLGQPSRWLTSRELQLAIGSNRATDTAHIRNHILSLRRKLGPEAWRIRWQRSLGYSFDMSPTTPVASRRHANARKR